MQEKFFENRPPSDFLKTARGQILQVLFKNVQQLLKLTLVRLF